MLFIWNEVAHNTFFFAKCKVNQSNHVLSFACSLASPTYLLSFCRICIGELERTIRFDSSGKCLNADELTHFFLYLFLSFNGTRWNHQNGILVVYVCCSLFFYFNFILLISTMHDCNLQMIRTFTFLANKNCHIQFANWMCNRKSGTHSQLKAICTLFMVANNCIVICNFI